MVTTIDRLTNVISIPQADLTFISGTLFELDTDVFRLELKSIEDSEEGIVFDDTHQHNTEVTIAGVTYARLIEFLAPYTIEFEDGQYAVRLIGSNNNIFDEGIIVRNQVSIISTNSAGLQIVSTGSGLSVAEQAQLDRAEIVYKIFINRAVTTDLGGGVKRIDFYDDNQTTIIDSVTISSDGNERTNP